MIGSKQILDLSSALESTLDSSSRQCRAAYLCVHQSINGCKGNCCYGVSSPWSRLNFM